MAWISEAFNVEDGDQLHSSGILPRLDAHLASLLADTKHLKSEIGMSYQSYIEKCQMAGRSPKGRFMIWLLAQQFRLDLQRGANLTEQSLLELDCESFTYNGLKTFIEKIECVLNAIPFDHQPSERTKFTWLFGRVKRCRLIQRHIDRVKDASPDSHRRTFAWLFDKLKTALWEIREDQNEEAIKNALSPSKGPKDTKPKSANAAKVGEEKDTELSKAAAAPKVKPKAPPRGAGKGKGKEGKGDAPKGPPPPKNPQNPAKDKSKADPKGKPSVPCLFYPKGTCNRGSECPFVHVDSKASAKEKAKQPSKAAPAAKATVATVLASSANQVSGASTSFASNFASTLRYAFAPFRFLLSVSTAISSSITGTGVCINGASLLPSVNQVGVPAVVSHQHAMIAQNNCEGLYRIEWIADSGAGRDLASFQAFEAQGVPADVSQRAASSEGSVRFETGNGHVTSDSVVHANGNQLGEAAFCILESCPLVRSLGQLVEAGMPFIWLPGELPYLGVNAHAVQVVADKTQIVVADRIEDHVPVFAETMQFNDASYGLAAAASSPEDPSSAPDAPDDPPPPPEGGGHLSDAGSEDDDEDPLPRAQRLQAEARSLQHRMCHIPKNPYCDICCRSRMYRRKVTRKRHDPLEARGGLEEVTMFGQRLAADFIIVNKSHANDKEAVVLVVMDEFSGYLAAYPCARRTSDVVVKSILSFLGPSFHEHPTIMRKTDNAPEFSSACTTLGFIHEPTLARRFPHNSVVERLLRTLEEITRAAHLGAGFQMILDLWQHSVQYASTVINAYHPIKDKDGNSHNRHELASGKAFEGRQLILGQLVYVRKGPLNRHKFEANAVPSLFVGWRYDSGPKSHKGIYLVIDYAAVKSQKSGYSVALSVPCEEVYVPPGDPILPLHAAAETALADFSEPNLTEYLPKEIPFSSLPSDASPAVRHEYITLDRIIRFGATPDCKACSELKGRHNSRCKARFDMLIKAEKASRVDKSPETPMTPRTIAPSTPMPPTSSAPRPEAIVEESTVGAETVDPDTLPFSAGIPPGHPEAAMINRVASTIDEAFIESSVQRSRYRRMNNLSGVHTLYEFACSDASIIGEQASNIGISCIRLSRSALNLCDPVHVHQAIGQLESTPGADAWASVTCTHHSPIQNLNIHIYGKKYKQKLNERRVESETLLQYAIQFLERALGLGGRIGFELPAENQLWNHPQWLDFEKRACLRRVYFHGCALNLKGKQGKFLKKPWCISTSDMRLIQFFAQHQCDKTHEHEESLGKNATKSAFYTPEFANTILEAWYPRLWYKHVPDLSSTSALVTKNLTKAQWKQDAKAIEAIEAEATGLRANGTWLDESVIPLAQLKKQARASGEDIKIAEVLTLAGIKHSELEEQFHRYKGRIVYRGDQIRNQSGDHVFFAESETATTPTTIAALNLTLWYGLTTTVSCADCVQAYLQCHLDGNTWVILPFELWLPEWKQNHDSTQKLAVKLVKSIYGHPQSGNLWQAHLEKQLLEMQGVPIPEYPSNFVFRRGPNREVTLLLNIYVDDLTLAGGCQDIQNQFWEELKTRIKIDPTEYITEKGTKILGRIHKIKRTPEVNTLTYDMTDYAKGIVEFFCNLTEVPKEKLRSVPTPCIPEASMCDDELSTPGQLSTSASKILMRCLWLSRLCRPDIAFAVQRLASRVTRWTKWEDRQTYRLISYLHATCDHVMKLTADPSQRPYLHVFTDSDFASCPYTAKSTSGIVYVIKAGNQYYPVMWQSKKQSSTARSTTEAELIAFASALFGESLHLHTMLETLTESNVEIVFEQDNQATITILEAGYSAKLRGANRVHRVNIASIHEQLEKKVFQLDYCMSEDQRANSLTKIVPPMHWPEALKQLCIVAP